MITDEQRTQANKENASFAQLQKLRVELTPSDTTRTPAVSVITGGGRAMMRLPIKFRRAIADSSASISSVANTLNSLLTQFRLSKILPATTEADLIEPDPLPEPSVDGFFCRSTVCTSNGPICGFNEFLTPSDPPKKYRTYTISGTYTQKIYFLPDCGEPPLQTADDIYSGTATYAVDDCAYANTMKVEHWVDGSYSSEEAVTPSTFATCPSDTDTETYSCSNTSVTKSGTNTCYLTAYKSSGSVTHALSDEDTWVAAIIRDGYTAGTPGDWADNTLNNCDGSCIQQGGVIEMFEDFTFTFELVEWKLVESGLDPSTEYTRTIYMYRWTGSMWNIEESQDITGNTDEEGVLELTGEIYREAGSMFCASLIPPSEG